MNEFRTSLLRQLRTTFLRGIGVIIPLVLTFWFFRALLNAVDGIFSPLLEESLGMHIPGLGFVTMLAMIFIVGLFTRNLVGRLFVAWFENLLRSIPFVRSVYSAVKDLVNAFSLDGKGKTLRQVVMVEYPRRGDKGNECDMDGDGIRPSGLEHELAHGFEEGETLNVADRSADFRNDHVEHSVLCQGLKSPFDLVGDVRNHLNGRSQKITSSFFADDLVIDLTSGGVVLAGGGNIQVALVVSQIEVRFCSVVGHIDFAMLERVHRSRIHIQIGVEFLYRDPEAALFQQEADGSGGNAFAEGRNHTPGDEDVFRVMSALSHAFTPFLFIFLPVS